MDGDFFAGIPVRDRSTAVQWYEALLGSSPAFYPNEREAVWELGEGRYLYVDVRPASAGHALYLLFVEDLDARLADIARRGLRPEEVERYENGVVKAVFRDPDGNEFGVAGAGSRVD